MLEHIAGQNPPFHTLTFNLATVYELCGERAQELKMSIARRAAVLAREGGQGEMIAADFKL